MLTKGWVAKVNFHKRTGEANYHAMRHAASIPNIIFQKIPALATLWIFLKLQQHSWVIQIAQKVLHLPANNAVMQPKEN